MTCAHVLGLIDAGPFADYPSAHLTAAREHARGCATCGPALKAATALSMNLSALPQLAPPLHLAEAVFARIARIDEGHAHQAAAAAQATAGTPAYDWPRFATVLGGLATGLAVLLYIPLTELGPTGVASPRAGAIAAGLAMPSTLTGTLALTAGLLLYVVGLFAPVGQRTAASD